MHPLTPLSAVSRWKYLGSALCFLVAACGSSGRGGGGSGGTSTGGSGGTSSCGTCNPPRTCEGTQCVCPAENACQGTTGTECVDKSTNTDHCGACDVKCATNATCESGSCVCPGGMTSCGTICRDVTHDNENCGACGIDCGNEQVKCVASKCREVDGLAGNQDHPFGIALDATHVYWTNRGAGSATTTGQVMSVELDGGTPVELANGLSIPEGIAVDASSAYVGTKTQVLKIPLAGGVVELAAETHPVHGVAVNASHVYWTTTEHVARTTIAPGGALEVLTNAYIGEGTLAIDGTSVYVAAEGDGKVLKLALAGGPPEILATDQYDPRNITLDDTSVYFTNFAYNGYINNDLGSLASVPKAGGDVTLIATKLNYPTGVAVSGSVYWAQQGQIHADPGGILVAPVTDPIQVAVNATHVYWTSAGAIVGANGSVSRTIK